MDGEAPDSTFASRGFALTAVETGELATALVEVADVVEDGVVEAGAIWTVTNPRTECKNGGPRTAP